MSGNVFYETILEVLNWLPPTSLPLITGAFFFFVFFQFYASVQFRQAITYGAGINKYGFLWFLLFLYSIFAYNSPDFLGYIRALYFGAKSNEIEAFEDIYVWLLREIEYNNILFRIIIYSITYAFIYYIFKHYVLYKGVFLILYIIILLSPISNLVRASMADAVAFLGIFVLYNNHTKANNVFKFIILFSAALLLHKSTFLLIVPLLLSFLPFNNNSVKLYVGFYPAIAIVLVVIVMILKDVLGGGYASDEFDNNAAYILRKVVTSGMTFVIWAKVLMLGFKYKNKKDLYGYTYRFLFFSMLIWIGLLFVPMSHYVSERFMSHCLLPLAFYLSYIIGVEGCKLRRRTRKSLIFLMFCYAIINILDNIYNLYAFTIHLHGKYEYLLSAPTLN